MVDLFKQRAYFYPSTIFKHNPSTFKAGISKFVLSNDGALPVSKKLANKLLDKLTPSVSELASNQAVV